MFCGHRESLCEFEAFGQGAEEGDGEGAVGKEGGVGVYEDFEEAGDFWGSSKVPTPAFILVQTGRCMRRVGENMWRMLRWFYRQLENLREIEVLDLGIRAKEVE